MMKGADGHADTAWKICGGILVAASSFVTVATIAALTLGRWQLAAGIFAAGVLGLGLLFGVIWWTAVVHHDDMLRK